jgi:hypothetical protein
VEVQLVKLVVVEVVTLLHLILVQVILDKEGLVVLVVEVQVQHLVRLILDLMMLLLLEQTTLVVVEVVEVPTILKVLMVDQGLLLSDTNTSNFSLL